MSKFCANCGSQQPDEANVCGNCGNAFAPENVVPQQVVTAKSKKPLIIAVIAAALVVVLVLVLFVFTGGGYKKAIENRLDFSYGGDVSVYEDLAPQAYWDWREDNDASFDLEKRIEQLEKMREEADDEGEFDVDYDFEVTKEVDLTEKELKTIKNGLKNNYDISNDSVTDGVKVDVKIILEYDGDERTDESQLYIVEIDGDWYVVSKDGYISVY